MAGHITGNPYKMDFKANNNNPHVGRYYLARGWIMPWETVLDAACCTGYGTKLLSLTAKHAIGYEIDEGAIEHANIEKPQNCEFHIKDLDTCELPDVDVAVSIETIEHLNDMHHFVEQLHKHTRRLIIMTVPLGGTSHEYINETPSPATEKNDFMNSDAVRNLMCPEGSGWQEFTSFQFGYSHFGVYFKADDKDNHIQIPKEWWDKNYGKNA